MISILQTAASLLFPPLYHLLWLLLRSSQLPKTLFRMGTAQGPRMQCLDTIYLRMSRTIQVSSLNFTSSTMFVIPMSYGLRHASDSGGCLGERRDRMDRLPLEALLPQRLRLRCRLASYHGAGTYGLSSVFRTGRILLLELRRGSSECRPPRWRSLLGLWS